MQSFFMSFRIKIGKWFRVDENDIDLCIYWKDEISEVGVDLNLEKWKSALPQKFWCKDKDNWLKCNLSKGGMLCRITNETQGNPIHGVLHTPSKGNRLNLSLTFYQAKARSSLNCLNWLCHTSVASPILVVTYHAAHCAQPPKSQNINWRPHTQEGNIDNFKTLWVLLSLLTLLW